ncbi:MAG: SGNH/GDSL hydrolase family protein [Cyanobacteria bacterium]|jgi:lysophospholipase L1-like esterase|nr:SGNH/GDSL hydrolase family protein [Cyanobacteria bacterium GSL.Bin21]
MFKSRRKLYIGKNQPRQQRVSPVWLLVSIPLLLIILEVFVRLFFSFTGKPPRLVSQEDNSALSQAYQLKFLTNDQPIQGLPQSGDLKVERHPIAGYQLVPQQESQFWQINEQGWREDVTIPEKKPSDEIRVFILGGSSAFGYRNNSNQDTIAQKLEQRLNQRVEEQRAQPAQYQPEVLPFYEPDRIRLLEKTPRLLEGNYQVINAAVPGYASGNQLAQLALEILPYDPDLIIVIGGYKDLMLSSEQPFADIPLVETYLSSAPQHFRAYLRKPLNNWGQKSDLVQIATTWMKTPPVPTTETTLVLNQNPTQPLVSYLPQQPSELVERVKRYRQNKLQMVRLTAGAGIPLISAVQPEITGRNLENLPRQEQEIINELGNDYIQEVQNAYTELAKANAQLEQIFPNNVESINLYPIYTDFPNQAFVNPIHLTSEANSVAAEYLYERITQIPKMQIVPREPGT